MARSVSSTLRYEPVSIRMTKKEWLDEGERRFGDQVAKWRFECPVCRHVASVEDFRPFKERGATPDSATCECLGRYTGGRSAFYGEGAAPCDYAGFGFFRLSPVVVIDGDDERHCFAFAEVSP